MDVEFLRKFQESAKRKIAAFKGLDREPGYRSPPAFVRDPTLTVTRSKGGKIVDVFNVWTGEQEFSATLTSADPALQAPVIADLLRVKFPDGKITLIAVLDAPKKESDARLILVDCMAKHWPDGMKTGTREELAAQGWTGPIDG